ncbi:actinodin1 [Corythoichthys intestinalis]|uniref:actinodin1 n=1 Tax=Corythoichthys intestinalis TaxID=161448 RepID=UPI0025A54A1E|nr:actinodin1 [Corythoichthys intestinalis]
MAGPRRSAGFAALLVAGTLAAVVIVMPTDVSAGPVAGKTGTNVAESLREKAAAGADQRRLIRNRRNISWYKQHSDFWNWYKYFTDNGNQEAVQELDRIYLSYLQNKNRAEGRRSYKAYLRHLGEIYKSCADSDDPNCVASYTSRPKPEPPKPAPLKSCDPTKDPYCLYAAMRAGKSPYLPLVLPAAPAPPPAPVKSPAPLFARSAAPAKDPQAGYYYYAPSAVSFLSKEQKAELLRICNAEDVECLQYHLRAAYGYSPSAGSPPAALAHLGCDPKVDPTCKPQPVRKAPSGLYLQYPTCDPLRDPYCAYAASLVAPRAPNPPAPAGPGSCNPIFEDGCNPLTATKYATPPEAYTQKQSEEAAALRAPPPAADHYNDPYGMYRDANRVTDPYAAYRQASPPPANDHYAMLRRFMTLAQSDPYAPRAEATPESNDPYSAMRDATMRHRAPSPFSPPTYEETSREERHPLGPPGKTKEGYDCFIGYDRECFPLRQSEPRSGAHRRVPYPAEAYEPHLKADGTRDGVMEPADPHCDPEYDRDCRLRRFEAEQLEATPEPPPADDGRDLYEAELAQSGHEEPRVSNQPPPPQGMPSLQDILQRYGDQFPEHDDYRKK